MEGFEIQKYLDIALRRKYWVIIPFLLTVLSGLCYWLIAPRVYEAETLIFVQPQRVPEDFVRSIVSGSVEDRLRTISQQVTSRTNLEEIIKKFNLFDMHEYGSNIDYMVRELRKRIKIDVMKSQRQREASTFTIAYRDKDPVTVMKVTNALASNFITENLRVREAQAFGTSTFLADELKSVRSRLLEKEKELKDYRESYMGGLPEQLQTNLSILGRLQGQLDQLNKNVRDIENRKILVQTQLSDPSLTRVPWGGSPNAQQQGVRDIQSLRDELTALEAKYTSKHPDIIRLKETIASMEQGRVEDANKSNADEETSGNNLVDRSLKRQLKDMDLEIATLKEEIKKTQAQINSYQKKVEETPKREQELLSLNRDYKNLKDLYDSLLHRKLEAEIAVSMERKQKGEQFRVIDPAKVPNRPTKPDMNRVILLTLVLGLGLGLGIAYMAEFADASYKSSDEVERELQLPVLVAVPFSYTEEEQRNQKIKAFLKAASVTVGFVICAVGIVFATKGIGTTVNYVKTILDRI